MKRAPLLAVLTLLLAGVARAEPGESPAEALFREGRAAADAGDQRTACQRFAESDRLEPAVGTWLNLGLCSEKLAELLAARAYLERALQALPPDDPRRAIAEQSARDVERRLAFVTLVPSASAPEGTNATLAGVEHRASSFDRAVPLNPGDYAIVVSAPGREPRTYRVSLAEGARARLEIEPGAALSPRAEPARSPPAPKQRPPAPLVTDEPGASSQRTWAYVLGGSGVVLLGVSGVSALLVQQRKQTVERECPDQLCRSDEGYDAASSGRTFSLLATGTFVAGAAALGTGVVLLVTAPHEAPTSRNALRLTPLVAQRGAGLNASLGF
jgi:hypothetical protein